MPTEYYLRLYRRHRLFRNTVLVAVSLPIMYLSYDWLAWFFWSEDCVDRGGFYDDYRGICHIGNGEHPTLTYVSYCQRQAALIAVCFSISGFLVLVGGLLILLSQRKMKRVKRREEARGPDP